MKRTITCLFLVISTLLNAQLFTVDSYKDSDPFGYDCVFPVVSSTSHDAAADKINTYIQIRSLAIDYNKGDDSLFRNVFPPEGEIWGNTEYNFQVNHNTDKFFSVTITYSGTGAYSEYYSTTYNFVASTGEFIVLNDLFSRTALSDLGFIVNERRYSEIMDFMEDIDVTGEDLSEQYEMYNECKDQFFKNNWLPITMFTIMDDGIRFERERCSNHAMMALDDLGRFSQELSFKDLEMFMNENFSALMSAGIWSTKNKGFKKKY
ncbi:MAG: hypothetical protein QNK23_01410 [Crocinitomicaceae bacterium]|nr:hypothetical protein [Crocinitomicaceae bacterium]